MLVLLTMRNKKSKMGTKITEDQIYALYKNALYVACKTKLAKGTYE